MYWAISADREYDLFIYNGQLKLAASNLFIKTIIRSKCVIHMKYWQFSQITCVSCNLNNSVNLTYKYNAQSWWDCYMGGCEDHCSMWNVFYCRMNFSKPRKSLDCMEENPCIMGNDNAEEDYDPSRQNNDHQRSRCKHRTREVDEYSRRYAPCCKPSGNRSDLDSTHRVLNEWTLNIENLLNLFAFQVGLMVQVFSGRWIWSILIK